MAIARVNRQARQPRYPVTVDTAKPITRGLVRALVCEATGIRDLMLGTGISVTGTYIPQATESGYGRRNNTINRSNYTLVDARTETVSAITIVWAGVVHRIGGTTYPFFRNQQTIVQATGAAGPLWSARFGTSTTVNSTTPIKIGSPTTYVYRKDGAIGSLFVDGVPALLNVTGGTGAHSSVHSIDGNAGFAQSNDITTNVMLIYDRPLSDAESRSLSINPWQVFRPVQRRVYFDMGAGGGATSVASDLTAGYAIQGAVSSDAAASYSIRGGVSAQLDAQYEIRTSAQSDVSAEYAIRASVQVDSSAAYIVRGDVLSDASASYVVRTNAISDLSAAYEIQTASGVGASLDASYNVRAAVQSDASAAYDLRTAVGATSEHAFMVRGLVSSDLDASYTVDASAVPVYADMQAAYLVDGGAVFIPSQFVASVPSGVFSARAPAGEYSATVPAGNYRASI